MKQALFCQMKQTRLACRMYKIEPQLQKKIKSLLLDSTLDQPLHYATYSRGEIKYDLSILIKSRVENNHGFEIQISVDFIKQMPDREDPKRVIRYFNEYQLQYLHGVKTFNDHLIVFGPKIVDRSLIQAIINKIGSEGEIVDPFVRIAFDLGSMDNLLKQFPNLKHFCIKDIPDDRTKGVVVKGNKLEETELFNRFAINEDTRGPVNFIAITTDVHKIIYLGKDGSIYSRMNFEKEDTVKAVYRLYIKLKKSHAIKKTLDELF